MQLGNAELSRSGSMETREPYGDYMARRLRENRVQYVNKDELLKNEIAEMQKQVHGLQMRVITLHEVVYDLSYKVNLLGGDSNQLELKF